MLKTEKYPSIVKKNAKIVPLLNSNLCINSNSNNNNTKVSHNLINNGTTNILDKATIKKVEFILPTPYSQRNNSQRNNSQHSNSTIDVKTFVESPDDPFDIEFADSDNEESDELDKQYDEELSLVYVKSNQGHLYKLRFRAVNTKIIPLYAKPRLLTDNENDKKIQPYSKSEFTENYTPNWNRIMTVHKKYVIDPKRDGKNSVMSFKKKIGNRRPIEPKPKPDPPTISASKYNRSQNVVFINYNNIHFILKPKVMNLEMSKPLGPELVSKDVGILTNQQKKNKGCLIGKVKTDLLKFLFDMEDINLQRVPNQVSRAVQVNDESVYIKAFSESNNRFVNVPIPKKIYCYYDPMVAIRKRNHEMKCKNIEPRWLMETRKKRLEAYNKCRVVNPLEKAYEATFGSSLVYEGPGTINKAKQGMIKTNIKKSDEDRYERWVGDTQREPLAYQPVEEPFENFDSNSIDDVPDWDLVMYLK